MDKNKFLKGKKPAQAMAEFAIALPILLLLVYGILEAGRLLFLYSTVVTASRQAVRYGATTGEGNGGVPRYQDCTGIRTAAQNVGYLGPFDTITLAYDTGPGTTPTSYCPDGANSDSNLTSTILEGNRTRLIVRVTERFTPLVSLVPFIERDIVAESARTILYSVPIVVEQDQEEWFKTPTTLIIAPTDPDPTEINQPVTVSVSVAGGSPTGTVEVTGADVNCEITLNSSGTGSCDVIFSTPGLKVISAFYNGDDDHLASSDTEDHTVTFYRTVTTILSDAPDPSNSGASFSVTVQVTATVTPAGTVTVDGGEGVTCTITLANGAGGCTMSYNSVGSKMLTATYTPSALSPHLPSSDTESHTVIEVTPTPTNTPTPTLTPTVPPTLTPSPTATLFPTVVPSCDQVTSGSIALSGFTMTMTVTNPYPFTIVMKDVTVTWNDDKGHNVGNKKLALLKADVGATTVWTGDITQQSTYTIPTTAILSPGLNTITFYFDQTYDNRDGTERIYINLLTPGCENNPIDGR